MRITGIELDIRHIPLKTPFITALRRVDAVESVQVRLTSEEGLVGWGEAPPTKAITGEDTPSILTTVKTLIAPQITGKTFASLDEAMNALHNSCQGRNSAKAAVDIALYDLAAQEARMPLYAYLGGRHAPLKSDVTISLDSPRKMAEDAGRAVAEGLDILKIKVGGKDGLDIKRIEAVRKSAGEDARLLIDANQAWEEDEALAIIKAVAHLGITLVEQPVLASKRESLHRITAQSTVPILADESVFTFENAQEVIKTGAADMINIKLMKCGGIFKALQILRLCEEHGIRCMMGSMLEGPRSIAAAAHLAMAFPKTLTLCDLDSPLLYRETLPESPVRFEGNRLSLNGKNGL